MPRAKKVSMFKGRKLKHFAEGKQDHSAKKGMTARNVQENYHPDAAKEIIQHMSDNKIAKLDPKVAESMDQKWASRQLDTTKNVGRDQLKGLMEEAPNNAPVYGEKFNRIRRSMQNNPKNDLKPAEADIDRDRYV
jgi:hypothetical protein